MVKDVQVCRSVSLQYMSTLCFICRQTLAHNHIANQFLFYIHTTGTYTCPHTLTCTQIHIHLFAQACFQTHAHTSLLHTHMVTNTHTQNTSTQHSKSQPSVSSTPSSTLHELLRVAGICLGSVAIVMETAPGSGQAPPHFLPFLSRGVDEVTVAAGHRGKCFLYDPLTSFTTSQCSSY